MTIVPPGSTIGIIGGGQLGRMLAIAAAQLGYRCHIYSPEASGPATEVAASWTQGAYNDDDRLAAFATQIDVATYEFENIESAPLEAIATRVPIHPPLAALRIAQDRATEKRFAEKCGGQAAPWTYAGSRDELDAAIAKVGCPAILKTNRFGYDGKGQARVAAFTDAAQAWSAIGGQPAVLEGIVHFDHEFSIIAAIGADGNVAIWNAPRNTHRNGILDRSTVSATLPGGLVKEARALTLRIAAAMAYVGVLTVEFFATDAGPVFNEIAPRVHNSGHWTIEGAETSQFENHIRAICGLPLGPTGLRAASAEMENLIGDDIDRWPALLAEPGAHVHLYGKHEARPGRKMGHVTRLG